MAKGSSNRWTPAELDKLKDLFPFYGRDTALFLPGRTEDAVINKANILGLRAPKRNKSKESKSEAQRKQNKWTFEMDIILRKFAVVENEDDLAKRLGLSKRPVKNRLRRLGIADYKRKRAASPVYRQMSTVLDSTGRALLITEKEEGRKIAVQKLFEELKKGNKNVLVVCEADEDCFWWKEYKRDMLVLTHEVFAQTPLPVIEQYDFVIIEDADICKSINENEQMRAFLHKKEDITILGLIPIAKAELAKDLAIECYGGQLIYADTTSMARTLTSGTQCYEICYDADTLLNDIKKREKKDADLRENISAFQQTNEIKPDEMLKRVIEEKQGSCTVVYLADPELEDDARKLISKTYPSVKIKWLKQGEQPKMDEWSLTTQFEVYDGVDFVLYFRVRHSMAPFIQAAYSTWEKNPQLCVVDFCSSKAFTYTSENVGSCTMPETVFQDYAGGNAKQLRKLLPDNINREEKLILQENEELDLFALCEMMPWHTKGEIQGYLDSIEQKRQQEEIKQKNKKLRQWSDEENAVIKAKYPEHGVAIAVELPGRSARAIQTQARKLGVKYGGAKAVQVKRKYSSWEDEIIKMAYPAIGGKVAEHYLKDRSAMSVSQRARHLEVKYDKGATEEDRAEIDREVRAMLDSED